MWNPRIWRADCALIWTALGFNMDCFQTRLWIQLIRSGETWTVGVFSVTKSSQRSRRKGSFWRTLSLSNRAKQGVSFLPKAHLAPGLSSGQTLVWIPESLLLALSSFARYPFGKTQHTESSSSTVPLTPSVKSPACEEWAICLLGLSEATQPHPRDRVPWHGYGSARGARQKLIPSKQNHGQQERERVKEHVSEEVDISSWSSGPLALTIAIGVSSPLTCGEKNKKKKILYMLIYGRNHHNIVITFQLKIKLKKFVDGIL